MAECVHNTTSKDYKILGIGSYGYVIAPGLGMSSSERESRLRNNHVSKLFYEDIEARIERLNVNLVSEDIDPSSEFTCVMINYGQIPVEQAETILRQGYYNEHRKKMRKSIRSIPKNLNPTVSFITYNCGGETIESFFKKKPRSIFFEDILPQLFNLVKGVQKIHRAGFAHFDIKPMNILIDENDHHKMRLIDFGGLVHHSKFENSLEPSIVDSAYCYYPPEIILLSFASQTADGSKMTKVRFINRLNEQYKRFGLSLHKDDENLLYEQFTHILTHVEESFSSSQKNEQDHMKDRIHKAYNSFYDLFILTRYPEPSFCYPSYFDSFSLGVTIQQIYHDALLAGRVKDASFCETNILPIAIAMSNIHLNQRHDIHQAVHACQQVIDNRNGNSGKQDQFDEGDTEMEIGDEENDSEEEKETEKENESENEFHEVDDSSGSNLGDVESQGEGDEMESQDEIRSVEMKEKEKKWRKPIFGCFPIK